MENKENKIPHLRICVTEACEHNCFYCRPAGEACRKTNKIAMSLRQIYDSVKLLVKYGVSHLKITGGEPLLRSDIPKMIKLLNSIKGIEEIQLITRSPKAGELANQLKESNVSCFNISIDSLDPFTFFKITRKQNLNLILQAIEKCHNAGLKLKFNMVVIRGVNDHEVPDMVNFAGKYRSVLKLLDLMNISQEPHFLANYYKPFNEIIEELRIKAVRETVISPPGGLGTPMPKFEMANGAIVLVKDSRAGTWYSDICIECKNYPCQDAIMALRLTSDGYLQRCLLRQDNLVDLLAIKDVENRKIIDKAISEVLDTYRKAVFYERCWKP